MRSSEDVAPEKDETREGSLDAWHSTEEQTVEKEKYEGGLAQASRPRRSTRSWKPPSGSVMGPTKIA